MAWRKTRNSCGYAGEAKGVMETQSIKGEKDTERDKTIGYQLEGHRCVHRRPSWHTVTRSVTALQHALGNCYAHTGENPSRKKKGAKSRDGGRKNESDAGSAMVAATVREVCTSPAVATHIASNTLVTAIARDARDLVIQLHGHDGAYAA
eukprot:6192964-Pleurochrysis_carterae.AAC.2